MERSTSPFSDQRACSLYSGTFHEVMAWINRPGPNQNHWRFGMPSDLAGIILLNLSPLTLQYTVLCVKEAEKELTAAFSTPDYYRAQDWRPWEHWGNMYLRRATAWWKAKKEKNGGWGGGGRDDQEHSGRVVLQISDIMCTWNCSDNIHFIQNETPRIQC